VRGSSLVPGYRMHGYYGIVFVLVILFAQKTASQSYPCCSFSAGSTTVSIGSYCAFNPETYHGCSCCDYATTWYQGTSCANTVTACNANVGDPFGANSICYTSAPAYSTSDVLSDFNACENYAYPTASMYALNCDLVVPCGIDVFSSAPLCLQSDYLVAAPKTVTCTSCAGNPLCSGIASPMECQCSSYAPSSSGSTGNTSTSSGDSSSSGSSLTSNSALLSCALHLFLSLLFALSIAL